MLTIDALKNYGADTASGLTRCVNNEGLYLRLVKMVPTNESFKSLYEAIKNKDLDNAFKAAHSIKGITANLALNPILTPVEEITELLRNKENIDYSNYLEKIENKRKELEILCNQ